MNQIDAIKERSKVQFLRQSVIEFYHKEGRRFPWRETRDPYIVLVTEILLQKTTSRQVADIFWGFFKRFPTVDTLANADNGEIETFVKRLGLTKRAKFLKSLADMTVSKLNSQIPDDIEELLKLKGVGQYTANAVLCFAYNERVPVVDSNIARVLRRYFTIKAEKPAYADKKLWKLAAEVLPREKYKEFNYGLLDLAAKLCHPKTPECSPCPLMERCSFPNKNR